MECPQHERRTATTGSAQGEVGLAGTEVLQSWEGGVRAPDMMPWCANPGHPCSNGATSNRPSLPVRWAGICDSPCPVGTSRNSSPSGASRQPHHYLALGSVLRARIEQTMPPGAEA